MAAPIITRFVRGAIPPVSEGLERVAEARHAGAQEAFFKAYNYNVRPVYDDSPFFFHYEKAKNLLAVFREKGMADFVRGHWPSFMLALLLLLLSVALFLFIFVPLMVHGRSNMRGFARWLVYFCLLGFSFIFVEICLMQRFSLLVPGASLARVLCRLAAVRGIGIIGNACPFWRRLLGILGPTSCGVF